MYASVPLPYSQQSYCILERRKNTKAAGAVKTNNIYEINYFSVA